MTKTDIVNYRGERCNLVPTRYNDNGNPHDRKQHSLDQQSFDRFGSVSFDQHDDCYDYPQHRHSYDEQQHSVHSLYQRNDDPLNEQ